MALLLASLAWAALILSTPPASAGPVIESIEGDSIVIVRTPEGRNKVGTKGTEIRIGDRIKTGPKASAKVRFEDGSKMLIGRATEMVVEEPVRGIPTQELVAGEVRAIIRKPEQALPKPGAPPRAAAPGGGPRFLMRTKTAAMGVRGTDFVTSVDAAAAKSQLHTLEGAVEVAKDTDTLLQGKGFMVRQSQMVTADAAALTPPQPFDVGAFTQTLAAAQPEFSALVQGDPEIAEPPVSVAAVAAGPPKVPPPAFRPMSFQVSGLALHQRINQIESMTFTTEVSWNPTLRLWDRFPGALELRPHLGIAPLKGRSSGDTFFAARLVPMISFNPLLGLIVEAGWGLELWSGNRARPGGAGQANVAWKLSDHGLVERIYASVGLYEAKSATFAGSDYQTTQFRVGIGLQL